MNRKISLEDRVTVLEQQLKVLWKSYDYHFHESKTQTPLTDSKEIAKLIASFSVKPTCKKN